MRDRHREESLEIRTVCSDSDLDSDSVLLYRDAKSRGSFGSKKMQMNIKFLIVISRLVFCLALLSSSCYCDSPPRITIQPNDLIAIEGESTELNCDAEGSPEPTIEWYHNGQYIRSSSQSRTTMGGSIQFLDIRPPLASSLVSGSQMNQGKQQTDTGTYYCLAKNPFGQARSRNASLQVAYIKPDFKVAPKDKLVAIGETVTFDCLPNAWPEPRIQWRHDGRLIEPNELRLADGSAKYMVNKIAQADLNIPDKSSFSLQASITMAQDGTEMMAQDKQLIDVFGSQLVIKQVDKNDEGKYSCLVETKGSHRLIERESTNGQLSASVKPYFIEAPEHKAAQVGDQVKLRCRMGGDPEPVISWRKLNGQPLSEKTQIDPVDKTLILDQVTIADQGTYVCEGENSIGSARTMAKVSVNSRPRFTVQPEDLEVDQGSRVQMRCAGEASPPPLLYWYKEGHRQLMFASNTGTQSSSSLASKAQPTLDWSQAAALVAQDLRSGSTHTSDTSPAINKLFTMSINTDQLLPPSFSTNYFGNRIYVDKEGNLNIINATSSDNGYYACALISSVGSVMAKAKLTIRHSTSNSYGMTENYDLARYLDLPMQERRTMSSNKYDLLPPPVIKLGAANQTLPTNTSVILVCEVVSQVPYKIQWFFESQILQDDPPRVVVLETGALQINNLRISDSGIYTCVVTAANDQAMPLAAPFEPLDSSMLTTAPPIQQSTSHHTMLKVASPLNPNIQFYRMDPFAYPSSPGPAYLVSTNGEDAITIAWSVPTDSGTLPIKEYVVEHYDTSQEQVGWRIIYRVKGKESLAITGLSAEGSHFFVIRAANSHGIGPSSAIAGPMRTIAAETRYQMEAQRRRTGLDPRRVSSDMTSSGSRADANIARDRLMAITTTLNSLTPMSSSSIKLHWSAQITGNLSTVDYTSSSDVNSFLEGYSIRYRAIGSGEEMSKKDSHFVPNYNQWTGKELASPSSLPLVTSYIDEDESRPREKRDLVNYIDYSNEFNEVRVVDHNTEQYTINGLGPFTIYQFFVVPYYRDIDGVPSNMLSAQTFEDKPSVAPPNLTVRPINNTAVRLLWIHMPSTYANGILRGYAVRVNRSDAPDPQSDQRTNQIFTEPARILNFPLESLTIAPLEPQPNSDSRVSQQQTYHGLQQYVVMCDLTNLTYKSFYSVQVAAATGMGFGPWGDPQNFIMSPEILSQFFGAKTGNNFADVMSKSLISSIPQSYGNLISQSHGFSNLYLAISVTIVIISIILIAGYIVYRRNDQRVITWKKTISEHFSNKFYMPANTSDPRGQDQIQQNIYDHQQHLIYSASPHALNQQQSIPAQTLWANNGCLNSSGTGSLSSHGGLLPANSDQLNQTMMTRRMTGEQAFLMNNMNQRFIKTNPGQLVNQSAIDSASRTLLTQKNNQIVNQSDYYSVINNMGEYEELDHDQRTNSNMACMDPHQTPSSNSDTSCPSSVTRLLPQQQLQQQQQQQQQSTYNRNHLTKKFSDHHHYQQQQRHHRLILQQQIGCSDGKQQNFATMINSDTSNRLHSLVPVSPYATTNLTNQVSMAPQQLFSKNPPMQML